MNASSILAVNAVNAVNAAIRADDRAAMAATVSAAGAEPPPDDKTARACGWFDSSWALREGLAVSELPDSDGTVAALWFADLAPARRPASARLQ